MILGKSLLVLAILSAPYSVQVERFRFQSNPWVNLHQRLLYGAQFGEATPARLSAEEKATWKAAVDDYRSWAGKRSYLFNTELVELNATLSRTTGATLPEGLPQKPAEVLRALMPLYERTQWAEDDANNRFWISVTRPMIEAAGAEMIAGHEKAYGMPFPKKSVVDVSAFGGQFGAYTVGDGESVHTVLSHLDDGYQGFRAMEMLMHETSHGIVGTRDGAIGADITRASRELGRRPPHDLWHALLFYTSGEMARQALARRGILNYEPVAAGMWDRAYPGMRQPVETHWGAYLAGKVTREEAMRQIVLETGKPVE